ncbi:MAG: trigger factor [Chitinophagales bacterium]|nr:trigger factor [Chitinophagales bacterium]
MPKVVREDIDNLNAVLTVTLEKSDYESKYNAELSKYRKQGQMKGFRKGKTPLSVIKKMYGKAILADAVNEKLQSTLYEYLTEEDISILGQPIPSDSQEPIDFDTKELIDFVFKFDLGIAPEFEVQGLDGSFEKLAIEVADEMIAEDLESLRKRLGERIHPEDDIQDNDIIKFSAKEKGKEEGLETEFSILMSSITEAAQKQLLPLKKGDSIDLNVFELEVDKDEKHVRKYLLNLKEEDEQEVNAEFECTIIEVSRVAPAELNQAFFDQAFGEGEVSSEEEVKEKITAGINSYYDTQAEALLSRDIQEKLIEANELDLPNEFLKRWMKASNEGVSEEVIEKEYPNFSKNLQWSLIRSKLAKQHEVKVEEDDVMDYFRNSIRNYFSGQGMMAGIEQIVDSTAMRMMEDEEQYERAYGEVMTDKLFKALSAAVSVEKKVVSKEDFEKEVADARAAAAAAQAANALAETEEE